VKFIISLTAFTSNFVPLDIVIQFAVGYITTGVSSLDILL